MIPRAGRKMTSNSRSNFWRIDQEVRILCKFIYQLTPYSGVIGYRNLFVKKNRTSQGPTGANFGYFNLIDCRHKFNRLASSGDRNYCAA